LSLGACVDDKESASVEKIRNAKAEQLLSIAELNKADAYAKKVLADAEAALKAAEAELQKIEAEQKKVLVEEEKVRLEQQKADLAVKLAGQEQALEAALLNAKAQLLTAQQSYLNALNTADENEKIRLRNLVTAYTTAASTLNTYKGQLTTLKNTLIRLENDLVTEQEYKNAAVTEYKNQIANYEAQKATYEAYSTVDRAEAKKAYDKAYSEYQVLNNTAQASYNKVSAAQTELNNVNTKLSTSYNAYYRKLYNVFAYETYGNKYIYQQYVDGVPYYVYDVTDDFDITKQVPLFTATRITKYTSVEYIYDDQTYGGTNSYSTITDYYTVQKEGFDAYIAAYEKYIKDNQQKTFDKAKKDYEKAVEDEAEAKETAEAEDATEEDKQLYRDAYYLTLSKKTDLDNATANLEYEQERLAKVKEAYAFVTGEEQTTAVKALVDSYNALSKEICDLYIQYYKDNRIVSLKWSEVSALENIYINAIDIVTTIDNCNTQITYYERLIADVSSITSIEAAIERQKDLIKIKEVEIAEQEKVVAKAKDALDAATEETAGE
jgi:hypothetical protein